MLAGRPRSAVSVSAHPLRAAKALSCNASTSHSPFRKHAGTVIPGVGTILQLAATQIYSPTADRHSEFGRDQQRLRTGVVSGNADRRPRRVAARNAERLKCSTRARRAFALAELVCDDCP
jgi:hypothetical protein